MIEDSLSLEIWDRLLRGSTLEGLPLNRKDGRLDLRGLVIPEPSVRHRYRTEFANVAEIEGGAIFHRAKWDGFDLSQSTLNGLRFFESEITNCKFDDSQLQDLRMWSTKFNDISLYRANLCKSALGGVQNNRRNQFSNVDFTEADLRQTTYAAASFDSCCFCNTKLEGVDFQTSTFIDCKFEGELLRVTFYNRAFRGERFPENEMINVDFRLAKLRFVKFRGLKLDRVLFPDDAEHIVINHYVASLDRLLAELKDQTDIVSRKLAAYFGVSRRWVAPNQNRGILNLKDLAEIAGVEGANRVREFFGGTDSVHR